MKLIATIVIAASMFVGTASGAKPIKAGGGRIHPCVQEHSLNFCNVRSDRNTIRILRGYIRKQERRTHTAAIHFKPIRKLTWKVLKLQHVSDWHRHLLKVLKQLPTWVVILHPDDWACLHKYEAGSSWAMTPYSNPPSGGPYWGGLQMNWDFMRTWGADMLRKYHGQPASAWSVHDQLVVAQRAWFVRGYQPWSTAGACGL